jgi:signal transduction histidine kinase
VGAKGLGGLKRAGQASLLLGVALVAFRPAGAGAAPPEEQPIEEIVIGIDYAFPPYQWVDESGEARGFDVDLIRAVADEMGIDYEIRSGTWDEIRDQLERGEIDVSPGMVRTPYREPLLDFSIPTLTTAHAIFVRRRSTIKSTDDLAGRVVAVERGSVVDDELLRRQPAALPLRAETALEALRLLVDGKAEAAILLYEQGLYFNRKHGFDRIRSVWPSLTPVRFRFGVLEGRDHLLATLNEGLFQLREGPLQDAIHDKWFGVLRPRGPLASPAGRVLIAATALIAVLLLAAALWSRTLRRQVQIHTRALQESEAEARRLERRLLQTQKMEALGRMAGGVAHDFDNVLTTIIGNATLALETTQPGSAAARAFNAIWRAGEAGASLTRQLLDFARGEAAEKNDVRWRDVIDEGREMLERLTGSRVSLHLDTQSDLWPVRMDPGQALQILMNLVINARDAIGDEGTIVIEAANVTPEGRDQVRLSVRDDGAGMDAETREQIFEPFFTTKPTGRGTGLGLATVYGIVESSGGTLEVESELGAGSTFHILLPRASEQRRARNEAAPDAIDGAATTLLVEDDEGVRELVGILLRSMGHEVVEAADGERALDLVREKRDFDLLVTDLQLPGLSGGDLARQVIEEFAGIRVIFLSGYTRSSDLPQGARVAFLRKPFARESLEETLDGLFAGSP